MGEQCSPLQTNNIIANNIKLRCDLIIDNFSPFQNSNVVRGLMHVSFILISKCKCAPFALPVLPTLAISCPCFTSSPYAN